ncbi:SpaA isopeptide-forming pilin-related protein [Streptomyces sp. SCSIO 30461]|uniref:MSCRAMM family protein n=1 Tax=Streptomyces sp. SCSIO 30461 TaxID=3118085 RepID=UPI0030D0F6B4
MRIRAARRLPAAIAVTATVTGTLVWAPTATAQPTEPTPAASAADAGTVTILKKDPAGDVLGGATFTLYDATGTEAAMGRTDTTGKLAFTGLAPGIYRLKEVSSGSPLHDTVADQDVIVTPGADTPLTITDPFKPAQVLLQAKDDKTGKLLPGATVNIGTGTENLLTLTTGPDGTATAKLPVTSRTGTDFWAKQAKAPAGYDLYQGQTRFKAKPADKVTVTVTNAKTSTPPPSPDPSDKPTTEPTTEPTPQAPDSDSSTDPSTAPSHDPQDDATASSTPAPAPSGSLARTGADTTPWLLGGAGLLLAAGGTAAIAARRHRNDTPTDDTDES